MIDEMVTTIRPAASRGDWEQSAAMLHDFVEWIRAAAGFDPLAEQPALAGELADLRRHYASPDRTLLIAYLGDVAVGTVALCRHADGAAELKRMYVRAFARGRGVADALIGEVVALAERSGCTAVWLETLRGCMDRAIAVYRRHGFVAISVRGRTLDVDGVVVMQRELVTQPRCA